MTIKNFLQFVKTFTKQRINSKLAGHATSQSVVLTPFIYDLILEQNQLFATPFRPGPNRLGRNTLFVQGFLGERVLTGHLWSEISGKPVQTNCDGKRTVPETKQGFGFATTNERF
jgi:hypothetical protein